MDDDPAVWWIGQFVNFIMRQQISTMSIFEEYGDLFYYIESAVGVHVRRTDKINSFHKLEHMYHVDEYFKLKELTGDIYYRIVYLATDDPTLYNET